MKPYDYAKSAAEDKRIRAEIGDHTWVHRIKDHCMGCERDIVRKSLSRIDYFWQNGNYCRDCNERSARIGKRIPTEAQLNKFFRGS